MAYTDRNGKSWPDTMNQNGINLILDPVASMQAGRPKYRPDPNQQKEYAYKYGFAEKPKEPPSALEGLAMVGAGSAALVGGQQLGNYLGKSLGEEATKTGLSEVSKNVLSSGSTPGAFQGGELASLNSFGQTPAFSLEAANPATAAAVPATPTGLTVAPAAEAGAANGAFSLGGVGGAGNAILPIAGALGAFDLYNSNRGARNRPLGAAQGAASGAAMGSYFGPWGTGIGAVLGGLYGATQHESTKDAQKRRWGGLSEAAQGLYAANHPTGDTGTWDTGKYAGQKWTFEKALDLAKEDPTHFQGVYGNLAAIGDRYLSLDDATQKAFVSQNIQAGNYASKKGDVIIKDKELANKILADIQNKSAAQGLAQSAAQTAIQRPVVNQSQWSR